MSTQHSYRVRFKTNGTSLQDFLNKIPFGRLQNPQILDPSDYFLETHVSDSHSFRKHMPEDMLRTIKIEDDVLTFCADRLGPQWSVESCNGPPGSHLDTGHPNNEDALLGAMAEICAEEDWTIVGAAMNGQSDRWTMLVYCNGEIFKYYYQTGNLTKPKYPMLTIDRKMVPVGESMYSVAVDGVPLSDGNPR